ncbi:MAG: hypothetical protein ACOZE7_02585 [Pseudomonadota bacterium]
MNRLKHLCATIFVSPEVAIALAVATFATTAPKLAAALGEAIRTDGEVWKYLPGLTLIFSGAAINSSFKLRAPLESPSNKILYHWPGYQLLVDRVYIGLFYGIFSAAASFVLWIIGQKINPVLVASIFLAATLISGATALTMLLAQQKLRELLEANT